MWKKGCTSNNGSISYRAKAQLELNLTTAVKHKNVFTNTTATKGELRRISIIYWMQEETSRTRKRLKYLVPSLPQSSIVRTVALRIPRPCAEIQRQRAEWCSYKPGENGQWSAIQFKIHKSMGQMGSTQGSKGNWQKSSPNHLPLFISSLGYLGRSQLTGG